MKNKKLIEEIKKLLRDSWGHSEFQNFYTIVDMETKKPVPPVDEGTECDTGMLVYGTHAAAEAVAERQAKMYGLTVMVVPLSMISKASCDNAVNQ